MRKLLPVITIMIVSVLLTGCLYPQSELTKNQVPNDAQLEMVQTAVDEYRENTNGLLPIKTKESDVPDYEKYIIDFAVLKEEQLIADIPGTAYENGGVYQYTIINPEDDPKVKVIDLQITEQLRGVNLKLNQYRVENTYPPFGEQIEQGIFQLNAKKLGYKSEPYVVSPFTNENLPFVLDQQGELYVDYRIDLKRALEEYDHSFETGDDIRALLEDNYSIVPAYSLPYTIENNEPVFLVK